MLHVYVVVYFFISGNFSFSFVVGYGVVCQCFEIKNYYNIYINIKAYDVTGQI